MKGAVTGFVVCLILVFSVYIMQASTTKSIHQDELTTNTSNAVEATIENCKNNKHASDEEMAQSFQTHLKNQMTADGKLKVEITECDHTKGILSVKVTETYKLPNGKTKTAVCQKAGMVDDSKS